MRAKKYGTSGDERYYSELYENTVYICEGRTGDYGRDARAAHSPLLRNVKTGERVFLRRLDLRPAERGAYLQRVLDPPRAGGVLWPVDLIRLDGGADQDCQLFADHEYAPVETPYELRPGGYAIAMPVLDAPVMPGDIKFNQFNPDSAQAPRRTWKEKEIQLLAVRLAGILSQLNTAGYCCNDLHLSRLIFPPSGRVLLDYSHLICPRKIPSGTPPGVSADAGTFLRTPKNHNYPLDFADPSVIQGLVPVPDAQSQNYSFCALLFYLFFNRGPYDGGLFAGYPDDTPYNHEIRQRYILRLPVFIFEPGDDSNAPGAFAEDEETLSLWAECPEILRDFFLRTLTRAGAERRSGRLRPEPREWAAAFRSLGWDPEHK